MLGEGFEENAEQKLAVALFERLSERRRVGLLAHFGQQHVEYLLGLQAAMQRVRNDLARKLLAEALGFGQHMY